MRAKTWIVSLGIVAAVACGPATFARSTESPAAPDPQEASRQRGNAYAHLMRAMFAARSGEFGNAANEIHRAVALQPESAALLVEAAEVLSWTGRGAEAERLARRALEIDPAHEDGSTLLAEMLVSRAMTDRDEKARDEALILYERLAEQKQPADPMVLNRLVQLRHASGDVEGAARAARQLVLDRPGDSRAARTLAQLLLQLGEDREALGVLLTYVAEHPFAEELLRFAQQLAENMEAWDLVADTLGPHQPYPQEVTLINQMLGEALLRMGRMPEAIEALERARDSNPADLRVRNHLAMAYRGVGRMADAAALLKTLVDESPGFPSLHQLLADTLAVQGDTSGALESYRSALRGWDDALEARTLRDAIRQQMALLHIDEGDLDSAGLVLDDIEDDRSIAAARIRGRLALEAERLDDARHAARELRSQGEDGYAALLEGEVFVSENRWSKAESRFEEATQELGPVTLRNIAEIYRQGDHPEDGLSLLEEWVAAEPDNADARFLLGEYLYKLDRFAEAEIALRAAFELDPIHAAALNFLGYSLAERNVRLDEALSMIERALAMDSWNGAYLDSLGWVYYQMGRLGDARVPLEQAARELPHDPTVLEHLGDLYERMGLVADARAVWERALAASAEDSPTLRAKIDRVAAEQRAEATTDPGEDVDERAEAAPILPPR